MTPKNRGHRPIAFVLTAIGIAFLGVAPPGQHSALASSASQHSTAPKSGGSCPLSMGQQVKAVHAFRKMMPVFRHPRCFNCHGGFDITSEKHEGSEAATDTGLDPRALLTIKERQKLHAGCGGCHDNIKGSLTRNDGTRLAGWLVAPKPMLWDGKDDEELCIQMKQFEPTGAQFVDHLKTDHNEIQFIEAAFNGDRGLGDLLGAYGLKVDPPPGTHADLVAKAQKWVDLVGNAYTASPKCGCVMPRLEGKFTQTDSANFENATLGAGTTVNKVTGTLVWKPADDRPPSPPTFGDIPSSFFRVSEGEVTIELDYKLQGMAGSVCQHHGRKTFSLASLPQKLLRYLWLEVAEDGRYKVSLVLPDRIWRVWQMEVESVCTFPGGSVTRSREAVNEVAVTIGEQQGTLNAAQAIVGELATPIRRGPRTITGNWSFANKTD